MTWPTRVMAALLRWSAGLLPADRRVWAHALRAEAHEVPAGWRRLAWLAGGVRLTVREAALGRRPGYLLAFAAAVAGTAWSAWSGPPGDSAIVINRVDVITIAVILAGLPWAIRRTRGPVAGSRLARLVRTGGYAAILVLVLVKAAVERVAGAPPNNTEELTRAWIGEAVFLAVMTGYAAVILACTARRSPAVPATVVIGTSIGAAIGVVAYALGPLGCPLLFTGSWPAGLYDAAMALGVLLALCAPVAAGLAATRWAGRARPTGSRARPGAIAGLCVGAAAALVVAVLSTATIALLPYDTGLRNWASSHIGQWTPMIGPWTPITGPRNYLGYVAGTSAFAAGYLIVLLLSPLFGCAFGAWAGRASGHPGPSRSRRPGVGLRSSSSPSGLRDIGLPAEARGSRPADKHPKGAACIYGTAGPCWLAPLVCGLVRCWPAAPSSSRCSACSSRTRPRRTDSIMPSTLRSLPGSAAIKASRDGLPIQAPGFRPWH